MRSGRAPRQMSLNADEKLLDFYFKLHAQKPKRGNRHATMSRIEQEPLGFSDAGSSRSA